MSLMPLEEVQNIQHSNESFVSPQPDIIDSDESIVTTPTLTPDTQSEPRFETLVTKEQMDIAIDRLSEIEACLLVGISFVVGYGVCRILYSAIMKCF